mmetsp:Transcript_83273/g.163165  ORF Transcript_83273/g.163165 Transcript_83273/m.163165 type:complete len:273 (+) Transcript_83273:2-820(+)
MLHDDFVEPATTAFTIGGVRPRLPAIWRRASCAAAAALGRTAVYSGDARKVAEEVSRLLHSSDWEERAIACEALGNMGASARHHAMSIADLFADSRHAVRAQAAFAYGKLGNIDCIDHLIGLLEDKSPSVRREATRAVARLDEDACEYIGEVARRLCDTSPEVRKVAAEALALVGPRRGRYYAGALAQRLVTTGEATAVKIAALRALGGMGERGAVYADAVSELVNDCTPELREAAEKCLRSLGVKAMLLPIGSAGGGENEGGGEGEGGAEE